jgi:hypothetical protein
MTDLDALRARHIECDREPECFWCEEDKHCRDCGGWWPCDAAQAVAEADRLRGESIWRLTSLHPASFSVWPDGPGWRISVGDEHGDIFESLKDAIDAALAAHGRPTGKDGR